MKLSPRLSQALVVLVEAGEPLGPAEVAWRMSSAQLRAQSVASGVASSALTRLERRGFVGCVPGSGHRFATPEGVDHVRGTSHVMGGTSHPLVFASLEKCTKAAAT